MQTMNTSPSRNAFKADTKPAKLETSEHKTSNLAPQRSQVGSAKGPVDGFTNGGIKPGKV